MRTDRASLRTVDVGPVVDADHEDGSGLGVNADQNAVVAAAGGAVTGELAGQGLAQPSRTVASGPVMNSTIAGATFAGRRVKEWAGYSPSCEAGHRPDLIAVNRRWPGADQPVLLLGRDRRGDGSTPSRFVQVVAVVKTFGQAATRRSRPGSRRLGLPGRQRGRPPVRGSASASNAAACWSGCPEDTSMILPPVSRSPVAGQSPVRAPRCRGSTSDSSGSGLRGA